MPDAEHRIACRWNDGSEFSAEQWLMLYELSKDAESMAHVVDGFSSIIGKSILFTQTVGKGRVVVMGARPGTEDLQKLTTWLMKVSGAQAVRVEGGVLPAVREGKQYRGIAAQEIDGKPGRVYFEGQMTDLLTDTVHDGFVDLKAYQTVILKK
jgi:hypothetical protein